MDYLGPKKQKQLTFGQVKITGSIAELHWNGLALSSVDSCEYYKSVNDSTEGNIVSYKPTDLTLKLTNLKQSTKYTIILTCYDVKKQVYKSHPLTFTSEYFLLRFYNNFYGFK